MTEFGDDETVAAPETFKVGCLFVPSPRATTDVPAMPESVFAVPLQTLPAGLGALVNAVLELQPPEVFDFLYKEEYITTSLEKFMRRRGLNAEETLRIEYTPALRAQEGSKLPHDDWVSSLRAPVYGDTTLLLTGAYDHAVRIWSGEDCLALGTSHVEAVKEVSINYTTFQENAGNAVGVGATPGTKRGRKTALSSKIPSFQFASCGTDGHVKIWQFHPSQGAPSRAAPAMEVLGSCHPHLDSVSSVDVQPSKGELLATGGWDNQVHVFRWSELVSGGDRTAPRLTAGTAITGGAGLSLDAGVAPLLTFTDHARAVTKVRFSPLRPSVLYSAGLDGGLKQWDVEKGALLTSIHGDHAVQAMTVKPSTDGEGDMVLTGHTDSRLRLWDLRRQGGVAHTWSGHRAWVYGVTWLWRLEESDGNHSSSKRRAVVANNASSETFGHMLASVSEDATVRVWDLRSTSSSLLTMDKLHTDGVLDVTYVGNGELASCGKDNRTRTFSVKTG